jgi:pimeloyl-ACP methyl ester carboxylesterase
MMQRTLWLVALIACGDGGSSNKPDAATPTPDAAPDTPSSTAVPRVEPAPCRFTVSATLGLTQGTDYACGDLVVYENRSTQSGRTIRLHYIKFESKSSSTNATIYLDGGPGGDGEGIVFYANALGKPFLDGLTVDGDFLVISQRGTALSSPFLDCSQPDCADFAGSAHLPSYNTAFNADDVNDLRATLGYDKLNVYGISYGSRLGLEVLRRHGEHVRAAVIEGLVPSQTIWPAAIPSSFYSALISLNAACADAGACGTTYGNLVTKFSTGVTALNNEPATIAGFPLDGDTYAYILFQLLYSRSTYAWLPLMINDLAIRRTDRIEPFFEMLGGGEGGNGISTGLYYSVVCGELFNPPDTAAFDNANTAVPTAIKDLFSTSWYGLLDACSTWPVGNLQAQLQAPVTSNVRTLVSSGRLDPITPPSFGDIAATTLSNRVVVVHESSGHGATLQSACGQQNLFAFLANPTAAIDMSCASSITNNYVLPSSFAATQIPVERIRAELRMAPIPPFIRERLPK